MTPKEIKCLLTALPAQPLMYMYKGLAKIESYKLDFSEKMFLCLKFFFKKIAFSSLTWPNFEKIQVSRLPTCEIEALFEAV